MSKKSRIFAVAKNKISNPLGTPSRWAKRQRNMLYRAKITRIWSTIESHYNLKKYKIVRDTKDAYIEVGNEKEAELIERLNRLETERCKTLLELIEIRNTYLNK